MEGLGAVYKRMIELGKPENFTKMKIVAILGVFLLIVVIISVAVKAKTTKGISRLFICFIHFSGGHQSHI